MVRRIRFGHQLTGTGESDPIASAQLAERCGFDVVLASDHVGPGRAPMPMLSAIAATTDTIGIGTFVLNADMRNPVQLAWEVATLHDLSGGRFELGLGAGHTPQEYDQVGIAMRRPSERKAALREQVEITRQLLDGETVTFDGEHYQVTDARIDASTQRRVPILVGGNGRALLEHAGAHADIVGLQGLGRTLGDGHRHEVDWSLGRLEAQIEQVRVGAAHRFADLELNALVQVVDITDQREASLAAVAERIGGIDLDVLDACPYVLIGSIDEIVPKILRCRERWGITYFVVRELAGFAPVIAAVRAADGR